MDRVEKVYAELRKPVDAILLKNEGSITPNFVYITDIYSSIFENSMVVVRRDGVHLIISKLEEGNKFPSGIAIYVAEERRKMREIIRDLIPEGTVVGYDGANLSCKGFKILQRTLPSRKFVDVSEDLLKVRFKKDEDEIERIREACKIADKVMKSAIDLLAEGMKEKELSIEIEYLMRKYGADGKAFDSIVAFGKSSAIPHYMAKNKELRRGEIILLDIGAVYKGYTSDLTRSFVFGKAERRHREMYEVVNEAQSIAIDAIKEEETFGKVHEKVHKFIEKEGYRSCFPHSTGHTIGVEVHDGFSIGKGSKEKFIPGTTFTLEPGIYIKKFGGFRLEDVFLFEKGKVKVLTKAPKFVEL